MGIRIGTGLSTHPDPRVGAIEAAGTARAALGGRPCDLAVVFASGAHLAAPEATLEGLHEALEPEALVGCAAGGVIAESREVEGGTAVSVWAAALDGGSVTPFHAQVEAIGDGEGVLNGLPELTGAAGAVLLADPFTFPADPVLRQLSEASPMVALLGGLASGRSPEDETPLFYGDEVRTDGAVGVRFDGVEILPCVSHGAAPIGPELTITAADGAVIGELAGRPALEKLRETIESLPAEDLRLVQGGLLMGIVIDANKPDYIQGDFLVRGLVGADPDTGEVAVGTPVHPGQVVRLHARDAQSADRDLRSALEARMAALGGRVPAGALLFSCNGRGRGMFGHDHHDASALDHVLGGAPAAGFFAAGEIGPVGGQYFLHGYTATVAVFAPVTLADRTVLLTGATGGLGAEMARALTAQGASLVLTGRRPDALEAIAAETGGRPVLADLAEPGAAEALVREAGPVDILIANAALPASGLITSFSVEEIDRALMVNLRTPMILGRLLGEAMADRGEGHLVFVSSLSGKVVSVGASVYSATKFGLRGFALALREDLATSGVGVSCVFPGFVRDAGMFADADVADALPGYVGTSTAADVVRGVMHAIEADRAEVVIAPLPVRAGVLAATVAPGLAARVQRRLGSAAVSAALADRQRDKR